MRPAVYASVLRNRKSGTRRIPQGPHKFSWRRFFVMVFVAAVLIIPGLVVTLIGLVNSETVTNIPGDRVIYKVLGPAALACGIGILCSAGIYYCCWGLKSPVTRHSSKHYKKDHAEEQTDPLHKETSPGVSKVSHISDQPHYTPSVDGTVNGSGHVSSSVRHSGGYDSPSVRQSGGYDSPSVRHSGGYDSPKARHGSNQFHHKQHSHRASSRSLDERSSKGHHYHSRLRSSSSSSHHHSNHSHHHSHSPDNQVAFQRADAPLARREASGSGDIAIDMDYR